MRTYINYTVRELNNKGFTLLELLYSLTIFCLIVSFIPITFQYVLHEEPIQKRLQHLEWEVFISQLKKELRMSDQATVSNNKVYLWKNGEIIIYEKYGSNIRRRVDYTGHEIVFQKVNAVTFHVIKNGIKINMKDEYGQLNEVSVRSFLNISE